MLSPSSVKQIPVRSSLQLQLLSRMSQIWLPVDSKSRDIGADRLMQSRRTQASELCIADAGRNPATGEHEQECGVQFHGNLPRCIVARLWCTRHQGVIVAPALRVLELHSNTTITHKVFNQCHSLQELSLSAGDTNGSCQANIDLLGCPSACLKHLRILKLTAWCLLEDGALSLLNSEQLKIFELDLHDSQGSMFTVGNLFKASSFSHVALQVDGRKLSCRLQK